MQTHPTGVQNEEKDLILHCNRCKWPCFVSFLIIFLLALFACSMMGEAVCTLGRHNVSVSSGSAILISPFPAFFFFFCDLLGCDSFEPQSDWLVGALFLFPSPVAHVFLCLPLLFPSSPFFFLLLLTQSTLTLIRNHIPRTSKHMPHKQVSSNKKQCPVNR